MRVEEGRMHGSREGRSGKEMRGKEERGWEGGRKGESEKGKQRK